MRAPAPADVRELVEGFPAVFWRRDGRLERCGWPAITRDTWCASHGVPHTRRPDPFQLLCEPWLDTEFTPDDDARGRRELEALGIDGAQVTALRARLEHRMLLYNSIHWDAFSLGHFDVVDSGALEPAEADAIVDAVWRHQGAVPPRPRIGDTPAQDLSEAFAAVAGPITPGWSQRRDALTAEILAAYAEPWRHFHTARHLAEAWALGSASLRRAGVHDAAEHRQLAWTVLFHDVVYRPGNRDHEAESARRCEAAMRAAGEPRDAIDQVVHAILWSARHDRAAADTPLLRAFWDADMGILGLDPARYDDYAAAVAREFTLGAGVPREAFRRGRLAFVEEVLAGLGGRVFFGLDALHGDLVRLNLTRERDRLRAGEGA